MNLKASLPWVVVAVAGAALAWNGCGGDGGEDFEVQASTTMSEASPQLTKAEFVRRVNGFCRNAWVEVRENLERHQQDRGKGESAREHHLNAIRNPLLAGIDFFIFDPIRILGAPPGEEEKIEEIIGPFQESVELGREFVTLRTAGEVAEHFQVFNERARAYGLEDCLVDEAHLRTLPIF